MIYFKERSRPYLDWVKLTISTDVDPTDFEYCIFKIDDEIYKEDTPEFWDAYKKDKMWSTLQKDPEDIVG